VRSCVPQSRTALAFPALVGSWLASQRWRGRASTFKAVMLNVYKANGGVCESVAGTMQPLEQDED